MSSIQNQYGRAADKQGLKPLLLCADDFGMSQEINAGIVELASKGCLSATSCMSRGNAFRQGAKRLADLPTETGLHLNLTEPLDGTGFFQPLPRLIRNCYTRSIPPEIIRAEIEYQLDAFEDVLARQPDYIDGHQHVHQFPIVRECLLEILLRRYSQRLPWLRSTNPASQEGTPLGLRIKAAIIASLGARAMRTQATQHGFGMNAHLLGVYGFTGGETGYLGLLDAWIHSAAEADLIMCHPARRLDANDPLGKQRCAEFAVLSGTGLSGLLEWHGAFIRPTTGLASSSAPKDT
jgi:chitin disaccharide deacetylase